MYDIVPNAAKVELSGSLVAKRPVYFPEFGLTRVNDNY